MTTILVVDDEYDIRELLVDTLLDAGFQVIEAGEGTTGLERANQDRPDLILLDIWMPGMNGFEVLWRLKERPDTQNIPVVLLSAMPATDGERDGISLGVSHYLTKPWEPGVVEAVVRVALRESGITVGQLDDPDLASGDLSMGVGNVDMKSSNARLFSIQGGMARLRAGRKKKGDTNDAGDEVQVIRTGDKLVALERAMGGGLPSGTVTLAVGAASAGKSVLCQHLVYGALENDYGSAFFSSEHSPESLVTQMQSIGLDVSPHARRGRLSIYSIPEPTEGEEAEPLLNELSQSIERLSRGAQFIAIDSITDLAGSCPEQAVIAFFSTCRRLSNKGRTIFVSVHSYAFAGEMFTRLRTLCDGYITLSSEQVRGKSVRTLEVNKINTTELNRDNTVSFVVESDVGMRLIPLSRAKV